MFGERCSLCGGKLRNHVCTECGLDNRKRDGSQSKYRINESSCDNKPLTHAHVEDMDSDERYRMPNPSASEHKAQNARDVIQKGIEQRRAQEEEKRTKDQESSNQSSGYGQSYPYGQSSAYGQHTSTGQTKGAWATGKRTAANKDSIWKSSKASKKPKNPLAVILKAVIFISILAGLVPEAMDLLSDNVGGSKEEVISEATFEYEKPDYSQVTRELSATGQHYDETLLPGNYIVGVTIPEGTYNIILTEGMGSVCIIDRENQISVYQSFYGGDVGSTMDDVRLYKGAFVEVDSRLSLEFVSENAQIDSMESIENPNTEVVTLTKEGVAGKDFPAGIYDLSLGEDVKDDVFGMLEFYVPGYTSEDGGEEYATFTKYLQDTSWQEESVEVTNSVKHVVIPEGTRVIFNDEDLVSIMLTPSVAIKDTDYMSYYKEGLY